MSTRSRIAKVWELLAFKAHWNGNGIIVNKNDHVIWAVQPYTRLKGNPCSATTRNGSCYFTSHEHADIYSSPSGNMCSHFP